MDNSMEDSYESQFLSRIFNSVQQAIIVTDINAKVIMWNEFAEKLYGYTKEEAIGKTTIELISPLENIDKNIDIVKEISRGNSFINEYLVKNKSGEEFLIQMHLSPISGTNNETIGIVGISFEITERKKTEKLLEERNEEISSLLEGSRLVLENKDFKTTAQQIFNFCRSITGAKAGYVALLNENNEENDVLFLESGGLLCNVKHGLPMPIRGLREVVYKSGNTTYDNNYSASPHVKYMPAGHIPLRNVMFAPIKNNGKTIGLLGLGEKDGDFTDYDAKIVTSFAELISIALINSRNLETLQHREEELFRLNSSKDRFFSILAHDLRSPFNSLLGYIELLQTRLYNYDIQRIESQVNIIYSITEQTYELLEQILMWAKSQSGNMLYETKEFDFIEVSNEILKIFENQANEKNIIIRSFAPEKITLKSDLNVFKTVMRNLIANAIKFTHENGEVNVFAEKNQSNYIITISDNGVGIGKELIPKLWEIDEHYSTKGTNNEKGSGFGLILCKELIEKNGGQIWVESEIGRGSNFKFTIPNCKEIEY